MSRDEHKAKELGDDVAQVAEIVGAEVLAQAAEHVVGGSAGHAVGQAITVASVCNLLKSSHHETKDQEKKLSSSIATPKEPGTINELHEVARNQAASFCNHDTRCASREVTIGSAEGEPKDTIEQKKPISKSSVSTAPQATVFKSNTGISRTACGGVTASTSSNDGAATAAIAAVGGVLSVSLSFTLPISCTIS